MRPIPDGWTTPLRRVAWALLLAWAGFWLWFSIASAIGEPWPEGTGHLVMAPLFVASVLIPWRSEWLGGIFLLALAAAGAWFFAPRAGVASLLLAPPAAVGLVLLAVGRPPRLDTGSRLGAGTPEPVEPAGRPSAGGSGS